MMTEIEQRLDRVESTLAIQQLPIRYAMAVDGRDVDEWLSLFVEDVDCGRLGRGRDVLRTSIEPALASFYRSQHLICGHKIDFMDDDCATGAVYCRAEHEDGDNWVVMAICYFDTYVRRGGAWYFSRRKERHWYASDILERPSGPSFSQWPGQPDIPPAMLPSAFPTWRDFWSRAPGAEEGKRTRFPVT
jgi:hypothetical protein